MEYSKNNISGQITIMAGLLFMVIAAVITVSIESAICEVSKFKVGIAGKLALEKEFSGYFRPLLDEYDIFLVKNKGLQESLFANIQDNLIQPQTFTKLNVTGVDICRAYSPLENNGRGIQEEILDYMKYGKYSDIVNSFKNSEKQLKKAEKTQQIVDEIVECDDTIEKIEVGVLELVELVEGLEVTQSGFTIRNQLPLAADDSFVKKIITVPVSPEAVGINSDKVYKSLSNKYIDVTLIISDVVELCQDIEQDIESSEETEAVSTYNQVYQRDREKLINLLKAVDEKANKALVKITEIKGDKMQMNIKINKVENTVLDSSAFLDEESIGAFNENIEELKEYERNDISLCNIEQMQEAISENKAVIEKAISIAQLFPESLSQESVGEVKNIAVQCGNKLNEYSTSSMKFNYEGIDFSSGSSGLSAIKRIYKALKDGTAGLVIDDWDTISDKAVKYSDLASSNAEAFENSVAEAINTEKDIENNILYNEYIFAHFNSYGDLLDTSINTETANELDYEIEYIIGNSNSDKENIKAVIQKMVLLKSGINFTYLFTDKEKKLEAYSAASTMLGMLGNYAVIKAGQYLIMTAWAYGEAVMDIRELVKGNKLAFIKTKEEWKLSLENLMKMKIDSSNETQSDTGLDYNEYLKLLLYMENTAKKNFKTMDLMEMKMINKGFDNFRMKNYIYKLDVQIFSAIGKRKLQYTNKIQYGY